MNTPCYPAAATLPADSDHAMPASTPTDAHELLGRVAEAFVRERRADGVDVSLRLVARDCRVTADPDRLGQVFANLLRTAAGSGRRRRQRRLTVHTSCPGDGAFRVEVETHPAAGRRPPRPGRDGGRAFNPDAPAGVTAHPGHGAAERGKSAGAAEPPGRRPSAISATRSRGPTQ